MGVVLALSVLGPFALALAFPAILLAERASRHNPHSPDALAIRTIANAGCVCGWLTVAFSPIAGAIWATLLVAR